MWIKKSRLLVKLSIFLVSFMGWSGVCYAELQKCNSNEPEMTPASRFRIVETEGTVFDTRTNLTWKRCAEGQMLSAGRCEGEAKQLTWNEAVSSFGLEGTGWRLPSVDELLSISEPRCTRPSINLLLFPDTRSLWFWTSTQDVSNIEEAWYIGFLDRDFGTYSQSDKNLVRLVRGSNNWNEPDAGLSAAKAEKAAKAESQRRNDEKIRQRRGIVARAHAELDSSEQSAFVLCQNKAACDKTFALTEIYFSKATDTKIQLATSTTIETHNPTEDGKMGLKAFKIPGKGASATISLTATCKDGSGKFANICVLEKLVVYREFRPFIERMMKE